MEESFCKNKRTIVQINNIATCVINNVGTKRKQQNVTNIYIFNQVPVVYNIHR